MRIAICLSGYFRKYKDLISNFSDFVYDLKKHGDVDIFFSTWDKLNSGYSFSSKQQNGDCELVEDFNINNILDVYKPKDYSVENFESIAEQFNIKNYCDIDIQKLHPNIHQNGILFGLAMFYLRKQSNNLKQKHEEKSGFKYDWVVVMRPDIFFFQPLDLASLSPQKLSSRTFYSDTFLVSSSNIIDKVSSLYDKRQSIITKNGFSKIEWFEPFCPEYFFENHLKDIGIDLSQREELGEQILYYYPRKHFKETCQYLCLKYNMDIEKIMSYLYRYCD